MIRYQVGVILAGSICLFVGCARVNHRAEPGEPDAGLEFDSGVSTYSEGAGEQAPVTGDAGGGNAAGRVDSGGGSGGAGSGGVISPTAGRGSAGSGAGADTAGSSTSAGSGAAGSSDNAGVGAGGNGAGSGAAGNAGTGGASGDAGGAAGQMGAGVGGASGAAGNATPNCGPDDAACEPATGIQGFCSADVCVACSEGTLGDASCSAAYGDGVGYVCVTGRCLAGECAGTPQCGAGQICGISAAYQCGACTTDAHCADTPAYGAGYLCVAGSCVTGDCHADGDCEMGQICGLTTQNRCGSCTADQQCQNDKSSYGAGYMCNTATQRCVPSTCSMTNSACSANPGDFCCAGSCVPGNCCDNGDCAGLGNNYVCNNHICTQCPAASGNTFYVDPVGGSDGVGTGSSAPGCAFKTITRALTVIGAGAAAGTRVLVLPRATISVATNGESFPLDVPAQVTISGSGGRLKVAVPANTDGFHLSHPGSGLSSMIIDGQNHVASYGIYVSSGADATTRVSDLDVQNMALDGIRLVGNAVLTIADGVQSITHGTLTRPADGLSVTDQAHVKINVTSGTGVHLDHNAGRGIYVTKAASIDVSGTPSVNSVGKGTLTVSSNNGVGVWIEQTPSANLQTNLINGLVVWANGSHGLRIVAGSSARLRSSLVLANAGSGVFVSTYVNGFTRSSDTSKIDLGTTTGPSYGANTLQAALGSNPNAGAGVCLSVDRTAGSVLNAVGNIFAGPTNCATSNGILRTNSRCNGSVDYSVRRAGTTANTIVVSRCQ